MDFTPSPRSADLTARVRDFIDSRIDPVEATILADVQARRDRGENPWTVHPVIPELQALARTQGLWNLFLPARRHRHRGSALQLPARRRRP